MRNVIAVAVVPACVGLLTALLLAATGQLRAGPPPATTADRPDPTGQAHWPAGFYVLTEMVRVAPDSAEFMPSGWVLIWNGDPIDGVPMFTGFRNGDRVLSVAGARPRTDWQFAEVPRHLRPGAAVTVWVLRGLRVVGVEVVF